MKHIYLFIFFLLCYSIAFSQCNNENDVIPDHLSHEGIAGQSFVANCSGRLINLDLKWFNPNTINYSIRVLKGEGLNGPQVGSTLTGLQVSGTGDWYNFSDFISNDMTSNSIPLIEGQTYTFLIETDIGGVGTTQNNPASTTDGIFYYDIPGYVGSFDFSDIVYLMETNSDPVITNVTSTNTDGTYTLGDIVDVIVTFNEVVNVNTSGGIPQLLLETGIIDQSANYISGSGTNQLTFRYNVQNGDSTTDLDYASSFALNLNGASIKDIENNDAVLSLPVTGTPGSLGANHNIVINCNITLSAIVQSDVSCNGDADGSVDLTVSGGTLPYNYVWSNSATTEDISGLSSGTYNVVVTDANGCTANTSVTITEPTMLTASAVVTSSYNGQHIACNGASDGEATVIVSGGTMGYTFQWDDPMNQTTAIATGLSSGTYNVVVTDANGCTANTSVTITEPTMLTASAVVTSSYNGQHIACNGASDGEATVIVSGGTMGYTFQWDDPMNQTTAIATGLSSGTYNVVVTDANGCTATDSVTIIESAAISTSIMSMDVTCNGGYDGSADLTVSGGTAPYTFEWNFGATTEDISGIISGTYNVVVTDANGCTTTDSVTINAPAAISTNIISTDVTCNGSSNGSADLTVSGGTAPYTFEWNFGATTEDISGLSSGTYNVVVTDANGCTATDSVTMNESAAISTSIMSMDVTCNGGSNGSADLTVSGGTAPYTFEWNFGATTEDISGLSSGTFNVVVTDANGCTATDSVTINESAAISTSIISTDVTCNGGYDGSADLTVSGGTAPYAFIWSNSATTEDMVNLSSGTYTVTVTDANGCTTTDSVTINEPELILNEVTQDDGILTATEAGMIYQWYACPDTLLTGETNQTYTPTTNGEYKVVISNIDGCSVVSDCVTVASLGLSDIQNSNVKITLFPNPAKYELYVKGLKISTSFEIFDLYGKKIRKGIVDSNTSILVDKLPVGMYFLKLDGEKVLKFIKK